MKTFKEIVLGIILATLSVLSIAQEVTFDISSLEKVITNPESILKDPDKFWTEDKAYSLIKSWHEYERFPIDFEAWTNKVKEYAKVPLKDRKQNKYYVFATNILQEHEKFQKEALPHIMSFLPSNTKLNTTVFLVEETRTGGFAANGQLVIDVTKQSKNGINYALNTMVHEVFHVGYGYHRIRRTEIELEDFKLMRVIDLLQNEGMAVYTAYKATSIFPVDDKKNDYINLENESRIKELKDALNMFFYKAPDADQDIFFELQDSVGYNMGAYYVFGAYMAKTIDEKLGREQLTKTVSTGPRSFISTYNSCVDDEMKIIEFKAPDYISSSQMLKKAYLENNETDINKYEKELLNSKGKLKDSDERTLNIIGYVMLMDKKMNDAIEIFKLNTILFPNSANAFDSLGEVYMIANKRDLAIKNYKKSLELNPDNENAKQKLKELNKE